MLSIPGTEPVRNDEDLQKVEIKIEGSFQEGKIENSWAYNKKIRLGKFDTQKTG